MNVLEAEEEFEKFSTTYRTGGKIGGIKTWRTWNDLHRCLSDYLQVEVPMTMIEDELTTRAQERGEQFGLCDDFDIMVSVGEMLDRVSYVEQATEIVWLDDGIEYGSRQELN